MSPDLKDYEDLARRAVINFWTAREAAGMKHAETGKRDRGQRSAVTAGKHMDGFLSLARSLAEANGPKSIEIYQDQPLLTLPGYFRPTKRWDMIVMNEGQLVAVLEFKSHVGPSFGNNFNNRTEEAIGSSHDFWTAFRKGAFGRNSPPPFLGWIMLLEDCEKLNSPVKFEDTRFPVDKDFEGASYAERYELLCSRLVQEGNYTSTALLASPRDASMDGSYHCLSEQTSLKAFVEKFAEHISGDQ